MCQYLEIPRADGRHRPREAAQRRTIERCLVMAAQTERRGCYCEASSRDHKWGLVLETIHYALVQRNWRRTRRTMKKLLQEAILERPLLGDGAMGTQLMIAGLEQGNCGEAWNLTHPERVLAIQRRYVRPARTASSPTHLADRASCSPAIPRRTTSLKSTRREWRSRARPSATRRLRARRHRPVRRLAGLSANSLKPGSQRLRGTGRGPGRWPGGRHHYRNADIA
jgi:hypothetical protein